MKSLFDLAMELMPGMTSHEPDPIQLPPTPNSDTMNTPPKQTLQQVGFGVKYYGFT